MILATYDIYDFDIEAPQIVRYIEAKNKDGGMAVTSFKVRSDLHIARKLWHGLTLFTIIIFYHNLERTAALAAISIGALLFISIDVFRQRFHSLNRFVVSVFGPLMRKHEVRAFAGTTYMSVGILIIALFFPKPVVKLTLFFLDLLHIPLLFRRFNS